MAIHILSKNGYEQAQLAYAEGMLNTPMILHRARKGYYGFLSNDEQKRLKLILSDYSQDQAAFAILLIGYCHSHTLLRNVFGGIDDYTELLLPDNMLSDNGFLHLLNTTDAISDEQYREVELIGWLYQFYISEKKDEVFAGFNKNKKAEIKDIPAATQFFTPNWIVKYLVQNTVGKIWIDLHPKSPIKNEMKYLVKTNPQNLRFDNKTATITNVSQVRLLDPASGSGHILVEGFDLLYKMYKEEYYSDEEAVESILKNNLFGLDIDKRAVQLAQFAVLLKAAKVFPIVLKKGWIPIIYAMPEPYYFSRQEILDYLGHAGRVYEKYLSSVLALMQEAQNLGSIMRFDLPDQVRVFIINHLQELQQKQSLSFHEQAILPRIKTFIQVYKILSSQYETVVTNPPYMQQKNMNGKLKNYVNTNYILTKSDLFAVFMDVCFNLKCKFGFIGMINQNNWMFLSSYEELREKILTEYGIASMIHLGTRTFDELTGEKVQSTAFILENKRPDQKGTYYRLVNYKTNKEKEENFLNGNNRYNDISQDNFRKIPRNRIGYWLSDLFLSVFNNPVLNKLYEPRSGVLTGKDPLFVRNWQEVSIKKIGFHILSHSEMIEKNFKWIPITNGGAFRRWYGNLYNIVNLKDGGYSIRNLQNNNYRLRNPKYYFIHGINWTLFMSGNFSVRESPVGILFGNGSRTFFPKKQDIMYLLGIFNSQVVTRILEIYNPTTNFVNEDIADIPVIYEQKTLRQNAINYSECNLSISKRDWDSHETSWDFQLNPLLGLKTSNLKQSYQVWLKNVSKDFYILHHNEEELNGIFIEIYGLQKELIKDVPLKEITILQDELDYDILEQLKQPYEDQLAPVKKEVVMYQLISYAIGCFMGRYRLNNPGLHIAHRNPTKEETANYIYNSNEFEINDDAIIPLMGSACDFPDDAVIRFKYFLDIIWGERTRIENLNFLQECLDQDVEKFIVKDFWKVHCRMYSKKPIYWLFTSQKGAFQVLVYMHRMNAFTVEKIRSKYLMDHLRNFRSKISLMEKSESSLNTQDYRTLDKLRRSLQECEQYDMALKPIADKQIIFDLDDGVTENYKLFKGVVAEIK